MLSRPNGMQFDEKPASRMKPPRRWKLVVAILIPSVGGILTVGSTYFKARAAEAPAKVAEARELGGVAATVNAHDKELGEIRDHLGKVDTAIGGIQSDMRVLLCASRPMHPRCLDAIGVTPVPVASPPRPGGPR